MEEDQEFSQLTPGFFFLSKLGWEVSNIVLVLKKVQLFPQEKV